MSMIVVYYVQMSCRWYVMARKTVDVSVESIVVVAVVKSKSDVNKADVTSQKGDLNKFHHDQTHAFKSPSNISHFCTIYQDTSRLTAGTRTA